MSRVTQCDVCKAIVEESSSYYIRIYHNANDGNLGSILKGFDVCAKCKEKIEEMIKDDKSGDN